MQPVSVVHPLLLLSRHPVPEPQQVVPPMVQACPRSVQDSQVHAPPEQAPPVAGSAQGRPEQHGLVDEQVEPTVPQDPHVPELQASPMQQGLVVEQDPPA